MGDRPMKILVIGAIRSGESKRSVYHEGCDYGFIRIYCVLDFPLNNDDMTDVTVLHTTDLVLPCRKPIASIFFRKTALLVMLLTLGCCVEAATGKREQAFSGSDVHYRNTVPGVAYVGSKVCTTCYLSIYEAFERTDMGRSMSPISSSVLSMLRRPVRLHDAEQNRDFRIFRNGSALFVSEYELTDKGRIVFGDTRQIHYVVGAGVNGFGLLTRQNGYLLEAPVSYYSKTHSWGLSPGYEHGDIGFTRLIEPDCISCHSGHAQPVPGRNGLYRNPPFTQLAIGCENCHGPGQIHVEERLKGLSVARPIDTSIINPAHLAPWLANNICMACHQGADVAVLEPGKDYLEFRPATPLARTIALFKVPLKRNAPGQSPLLEQYFEMILSKCYQGSKGRLECISCHDPRYEPSPQESPAFYRTRCLRCHTENSCTLPLAKRLAQVPPDDCAGCHMPKRRLSTYENGF
jgi:hypothetical protein